MMNDSERPIKFIEGNYSNYYELFNDGYVDIRYCPSDISRLCRTNLIEFWIGDVAPTYRGFGNVKGWKMFVDAINKANTILDKILEKEKKDKENDSEKRSS